MKVTYEKDDIIRLITEEFVAKGLTPDPTSFNFRVKTARDDPSFAEDVSVVEVDIRVSESEPVDRPGHALPASMATHTSSALPAPGPTPVARDLLAEAPDPGQRVSDLGPLLAAGRALEQSNDGPFSPERVMQRPMMEGESFEYPGPPRTGGR